MPWPAEWRRPPFFATVSLFLVGLFLFGRHSSGGAVRLVFGFVRSLGQCKGRAWGLGFFVVSFVYSVVAAAAVLYCHLLALGSLASS